MDDSKDAQQLRLDLKEWEHAFFTSHGRKPTRADIKRSRSIAAKYKSYDKLTRKPKSKAVSDKTVSSADKKRKRGNGSEQETTQASETPRKTARARANNSLEATSADLPDQSLSSFFSPAPLRTYVAPTPQKNGQVLGLFDLLSPESVRKSSPRRTNNVLFNALSPLRKNNASATTPSRQRMGPPLGTPSRNHTTTMAVLTPSTSSRTNALLTPGKSRSLATTPSIRRSKLLDVEITPEFLKRRHSPAFRPSTSVSTNLPPTDESAEADVLMSIQWSPVAVRQPRKPVGRSFSQIINANRQVEEERIEDDLAILRDLEEAQDSTRSTKAAAMPLRDPNSQTALKDIPGGEANRRPAQKKAADAQSDLPLGPDGSRNEDVSADEDDDAPQASQVGFRRYQKKAPKRKTRRNNLKPTQAKWQPEPEWHAGMGEAGNDELQPEAVATTNRHPSGGAVQFGDVPSDVEAAAADAGDSGSGFVLDADSGTRTSGRARSEGSSTAKKQGTAAAKDNPNRARRVVSATAHANYRTLKIKNKNSKAKRAGGGGRFARRRAF